jgi:hypothetical protein
MQVGGYTGLYLLEVAGEVVIAKLLADMLLLIDGRRMSERLCCSYSNPQVSYFYFLDTVLSLFSCSFFPVLCILVWKFFFNVARLSDFVTILLQPFNPITYTTNHYEVKETRKQVF